MKRKRFTEEQIIRILGEAESGTGILELCRKHGMANTTLYKWRRKYGGMEISDARRLKQLEDENHYLKRLAADQALDIQMLKAVNVKNGESCREAGGRDVAGWRVCGQSTSSVQDH